ncbi:hypothetical protein V3G39_15350 [Dermatophilaceae bacterium Sec6.4]
MTAADATIAPTVAAIAVVTSATMKVNCAEDNPKRERRITIHRLLKQPGGTAVQLATHREPVSDQANVQRPVGFQPMKLSAGSVFTMRPVGFQPMKPSTPTLVKRPKVAVEFVAASMMALLN